MAKITITPEEKQKIETALNSRGAPDVLVRVQNGKPVVIKITKELIK